MFLCVKPRNRPVENLSVLLLFWSVEKQITAQQKKDDWALFKNMFLCLLQSISIF